MSHFTVAVITKNPVELISEGLSFFGTPRNNYGDEEVAVLLQPYHEYECTGFNDQYVQDVDVTEETLKDYERYKGEQSFVEFLDGWHSIGLDKIVEDESLIDRNGIHQYGYAVKKDGKIVKVIDRTNPNAKWDWWVIGGRWSNLIPTKNGKDVDTCKVSEIDWAIDQKAYNESIRFWEVVVEGSELKPHEPKEAFFCHYNTEYLLKRYQNKENYAQETNEFGTFALITPDGEWLEKGEMGWFGLSSDTKESAEKYTANFKEILNNHPNHYITIVDCHI